VVGIPTLSDGLYMSWAAGSLVFAALAWLRLWRRGSGPYWRAAAGFVFAPAAAIGGALLVGPKIVEAVYGVANTMYYGQGGQGSVRMALYWGAIQAIGRSPLVGWGPGAHTGLHPTRIHQWEAHNGLLDWGAATGAPGVLLFILLHAWIGWRASARPALFAAFVSLVTLGLTHHDLRHPFYWFVMLFAVAAARQAGTEAPPPGEAPAHAS
jgi:O-antigen ligase